MSLSSLLFLLSPTPKLGGAKAYDCIGNSCAIIGWLMDSARIHLRNGVPVVASPRYCLEVYVFFPYDSLEPPDKWRSVMGLEGLATPQSKTLQ